jgi:hypothetical protein
MMAERVRATDPAATRKYYAATDIQIEVVVIGASCYEIRANYK